MIHRRMRMWVVVCLDDLGRAMGYGMKRVLDEIRQCAPPRVEYAFRTLLLSPSARDLRGTACIKPVTKDLSSE